MKILPYNSDLKPFAKRLRSNMTLAEVLLWKRINRQQLGVRFNRQKPIGKHIVDFYCKKLQLAVEVDGDSHNLKKDKDASRQRVLEQQGIHFLRFWDYEVKNDIASVIRRIEEWIQENPRRPSATPPLEGTQREPTPAFGHPSSGGDQNTVRAAKTVPSSGGVPERRGGSKSGAALVVVMWVLVIVAMIVSTFAFEMQLEARILSAQRKRFKADRLALAGVELAKAMMAFEEEEPGEDIVYEDPWLNEATKIAEGIPVNYSEEFGDGTIILHIDYEKGRRNLHKLSRTEWKELFDQANIPNTRWDSLLDCLDDWQDENDEHHLNGAESEDPFYRERGYECKNAPIDTVDELLLIKDWDEEILYGTLAGEETEDPIAGIAEQLTTWGDGKINPNSASREVLNSLNISEDVIDAILDARLGPDAEAGTEDDGITQEDFAALGLSGDLFTLKPEYVTITSAGTVGKITSEISCIFKLGEKEASPLFWLEGKQR